MSFRPWIGVDLDRTLAIREDDDDIYSIGAPVPAMVERVKRWLAEGKDVRIFTARVAPPYEWSNDSGQRHDEDFVTAQRSLIIDWCTEVFGCSLPMTAIKDPECIEIWDDRAKQVEPNTGLLIGALKLR